jgi:phage shock protein E
MPKAFRPLILLGLAAVFLVAGCSAAGTSNAEAAVREVSPAEAVRMLETHTVIDVRTPPEFAAGHIVGALNIPVEASDFGVRISQLDPTEPYLVYCRTGRRSAIAADIMAEAGFTDVADAGGLDQLAQAGAPIE